MTAAELMERGIRAYTRGQLGEAERSWRDLLALEPTNERALSYLDLLAGKLVHAAVTAPPQAAPVPLPAPASTPAPVGTSAPARASEPVPLPAPEEAPWMRPPITIPPGPSPFGATREAPIARLAGEERGEGDRFNVPPAAPSPAPRAGEHPDAPPPFPPPGTDLWGPTPAAAARGPDDQLDEVTAPLPLDPYAGELSERTTLSDYAPSPWDQGPAVAPAVVLDDGEGLDLASVAEQSDLRALVPEAAGGAPQASPKKPRSEVEIWMDGARELFALGDFSGSLEMIEKILKIDASHAEAREYLKQNEATLIAMYESKLGPPGAVPHLAIEPEEVMWLNLDHRAGFLLAQIDGTVSYDDLFALSGLPRLDTARIMATLLQEGVITS